MIKLKRFYLNLLIIMTLLAVFILIGCKNTQENHTGILVDPAVNKKERLGKLLFFEKSLSTPPGQDCSACHSPEVAFADPEQELPVSKGAHPDRYGNRNDMPVAYAAFVPPKNYEISVILRFLLKSTAPMP